MPHRHLTLVWAALVVVGALVGPAPAADKASATVEVRQRVHEGTDGDTVLELEVTNGGDGIAGAVAVRGPVPAGFTLREAEPKPRRDRGTLTFDLGDLEAGGKKTIRLTLVPAGDEGVPELRSDFRVSYRGEVAAGLVVPAKVASLKVQATPPDTVFAGQRVAVQVRISNPSDRPVRNIVLKAKLSDGLHHPHGPDLENSIGELAAGASKTIRLQLTPERAGEFAGTLKVTAGQTTASGEFRLTAKPARPALTAKVPAALSARSLAEIEFSTRHDGTETVRDARIVVRLPDDVAFVGAGDGVYTAGTRTVEWDVGDLKAGRPRTVRLEVVPRAAGSYKLTASLQTAEGTGLGTTTATLQVTPTEGRQP